MMKVLRLALVFIVSAGALQLRNKTAVPDVVIFGIGDSGTRGVKKMIQHLGVAMCRDVNQAGDNAHQWKIANYIPELLAAANGHVSQTKGYRTSHVFEDAVRDQQFVAQETWNCAVQGRGLNNISLPADFRWGYKEPKMIYEIPVMDEAFNRKQNMLVVARDPRDICTGDNQGQYQTYGGKVAALARLHKQEITLPDGLQELYEATKLLTSRGSRVLSSLDETNYSQQSHLHQHLRHHQHHTHYHQRDQDTKHAELIKGKAVEHRPADGKAHHLEKCMSFWSKAWTPILQEYAHRKNFLILRIEDLVIPDPTASTKSHDVLNRIMNYVKISPGAAALQKELEAAHHYKDSYMGGKMTSEYRKSLEDEVASYDSGVHEVMHALGYDVKRYGLVKPTHARVISP